MVYLLLVIITTNFDLAYRCTSFSSWIYIYVSHFFLLDFHCEAFAQQTYDKCQKLLQGGQAVQPVPKTKHILLVTKPSLHVAYNFAKLTPEENIFHTDIVTLENVSTSCLLFLKDRNASILKAGMACYHLLKNAFSWPNWKTLWRETKQKKENHTSEQS